MDCGFRVDLIVAGAVVVEIKAVGWKVGLLINFNVPVLREGIRRRVLGLASASPRLCGYWETAEEQRNAVTKQGEPARVGAPGELPPEARQHWLRSIPRKMSCQKHAELKCIGTKRRDRGSKEPCAVTIT